MHVITTGLLLAAIVFLPAEGFAQSVSLPSGKPANLCQELAAFVHQPEAATKAVETPPQLATAVTAPKSGEPAEKPAAPGTPQSTSGQSGQISASGPGAAGPQGNAQNNAAPRGSTATASGPTSAPPSVNPATPAASKPSAENVQQIEGAAGSNDLQACRTIAQSMRRVGIVMPAPLLALAAMAPNLLEAAPRP